MAVALVTGGRRGIGAAISVALARAGFAVAIVDLVQDAAAEQTLAATRQAGSADAIFLRADIADLDSHATLLRQVAENLGPLTCLVNNAGVQVPMRNDLLDVTPDVFDHVLAVNLRGTFFLAQAAARAMARQDAASYRSIVFITSANAVMASTEKAAYCISKAGLAMVAQLFASRLATHAIDVFEVQPGLIRTAMTEPVRESYDRAIGAGVSLNRRWGEPEDLGQVVATLVSGALPFCTGTTIPAGGGLHVSRL